MLPLGPGLLCVGRSEEGRGEPNQADAKRAELQALRLRQNSHEERAHHLAKILSASKKAKVQCLNPLLALRLVCVSCPVAPFHSEVGQIARIAHCCERYGMAVWGGRLSVSASEGNERTEADRAHLCRRPLRCPRLPCLQKEKLEPCFPT